MRDRIRQNHFYIFWEEGKKNLVDYVTKHHAIWHYRTMRTIYLKPRTRDIENSKDWINGTGRGCAGTTNPRVTRKPDNASKGTRNPIPRKPDYPIKGIWNLVTNRIQIQWTRRLTVPTQIYINLSNQLLIETYLQHQYILITSSTKAWVFVYFSVGDRGRRCFFLKESLAMKVDDSLKDNHV